MFSDPTSGLGAGLILWLCFCWEGMRFSFLLGQWDPGRTPTLLVNRRGVYLGREKACQWRHKAKRG